MKILLNEFMDWVLKEADVERLQKLAQMGDEDAAEQLARQQVRRGEVDVEVIEKVKTAISNLQSALGESGLETNISKFKVMKNGKFISLFLNFDEGLPTIGMKITLDPEDNLYSLDLSTNFQMKRGYPPRNISPSDSFELASMDELYETISDPAKLLQFMDEPLRYLKATRAADEEEQAHYQENNMKDMINEWKTWMVDLKPINSEENSENEFSDFEKRVMENFGDEEVLNEARVAGIAPLMMGDWSKKDPLFETWQNYLNEKEGSELQKTLSRGVGDFFGDEPEDEGERRLPQLPAGSNDTLPPPDGEGATAPSAEDPEVDYSVFAQMTPDKALDQFLHFLEFGDVNFDDIKRRFEKALPVLVKTWGRDQTLAFLKNANSAYKIALSQQDSPYSHTKSA